jgi:hypothetical protein
VANTSKERGEYGVYNGSSSCTRVEMQRRDMFDVEQLGHLVLELLNTFSRSYNNNNSNNVT